MTLLVLRLALALAIAQLTTCQNHFLNPGSGGDSSLSFSWASPYMIRWQTEWSNVAIELVHRDGGSAYTVLNDTSDLHAQAMQDFSYNYTFPRARLSTSDLSTFRFQARNLDNHIQTFSSRTFSLTDHSKPGLVAELRPTPALAAVIPNAPTQPTSTQPTNYFHVIANPTTSSTAAESVIAGLDALADQYRTILNIKIGCIAAFVVMGVAGGTFLIVMLVAYCRKPTLHRDYDVAPWPQHADEGDAGRCGSAASLVERPPPMMQMPRSHRPVAGRQLRNEMTESLIDCEPGMRNGKSMRF